VRALGHLAFAEDHLRDAGRVPQIDEDHPTMITTAGNPAAERDGLSGVLGPERAGLVRADHGDDLPIVLKVG